MAKKTKEEQVIDVINFSITKPSIYEVSFEGLAGILFNKMPDLSQPKSKKKEQEKEDLTEREYRTWKTKLYLDGDQLIMPGENLHEGMKDACRYWGQKIPGEGNKTFTDLIARAVICEAAYFGVTVDSDLIIPFGKEVNGNPSKGKKSGAKVFKIRPLLMPWKCTFKMHVIDARLTEDVLKIILAYFGMYVGLGDWRPTYGRFNVTEFKKLV